MLRRWIASGLDPAGVTVIDPGSPAVPDDVRVVASVSEAGPRPSTVVLAIKPQQLDTVVPALAHLIGKPRLLLSILAGVDHRSLFARFAAGTIVRAMPNLPVAIGKGMTALYTVGGDEDGCRDAEALAGPLGRFEWIADESHFDAVTALSGCGPGFVFRFADALAAAGAALGLPADQARRLALATLEGSALMAAASDDPPATLADRVASPGGSTREGLDVLDRDDALVRLLTETLAASARRNAELAAAAR